MSKLSDHPLLLGIAELPPPCVEHLTLVVDVEVSVTHRLQDPPHGDIYRILDPQLDNYPAKPGPRHHVGYREIT